MSMFFMGGIAFQAFGPELENVMLILCTIGLFFIISKLTNISFKPVFLGILAYSFCFFAGSEIAKTNKEILKADHFSRITNAHAYIGVIEDEVNQKGKTNSTIIRVLYVKQDSAWKKSAGRILAYFPVNGENWVYGDKLLIKGKPVEVEKPLDPLSFDYKKFLSYKNIYHQHFIKGADIAFLVNDPPSKLWETAFKTRAAMAGLIKSALGSGQEFAVASMIILGIKQSVDQDLIDAYSSSGAMHVLAVSGLHVGMIFGLIQMLLGWLTRFKRWNHLFYLIALSIIWTFGFITAFSPSVLRAVVMFTIIIIGKWINKKGNLYNTLGLTAFVILLFEPFMLFNVGFQMSFLAVFGIAYLHPQVFSIYRGQSKIKKWLWEVTSISLCAQLFTFPLGLFYFNQFPTYFLLSNLWVIPLSSAILYIGILFFMGAFWLPWSTVWGFILKYSVMALNKSMYIVSFIPGSLQQTIYFKPWEVMILYAIIISLLLLFYFRNKQWLLTALCFSLVFSTSRIYKYYQLSNTHKVLVGQVKGRAYITVWHNKDACVWLPSGIDSNSFVVKTQIVKPLSANGVNAVKINYLPVRTFLWKYGKIKLQIVTNDNYDFTQEIPDYIFLPSNLKSVEKYTSNTQIKKVILYRNKNVQNIGNPKLWDLGTDGAFKIDI
ncbi:MAG: ComEC family competence protein [Opitutaceae bacterium]|nr:ComEC family competence protein [Cytophagales bacterium]